MDKILTIIINHGNDQVDLLKKQIASFNKLPNNDVVVISTSKIKGLPSKALPCKVAIRKDDGELFVWNWIKYVKKTTMSEYDYLIVSENDIIFTPENFEYFNKVSKVLPASYVPGFIRYEILDDGVLGLTDLSVSLRNFMGWTHGIEDVLTIKGKKYFTTENEHQGLFILNKAQLKLAMKSDVFLSDPSRAPLPNKGSIDIMASATYRTIASCGLQRVIPLEESMDNYLIHHSSNRYKYCNVTAHSLQIDINSKL
jgi:hypothetical protein